MPPSNSKPTSPPSDTSFRIKSLSDNPSDPPDSPLSYQTDIALAYLSSTSKLEDLHSSLLHSLSATGWTERVRSLALELLRSSQCTRFEQVVDTVVRLATTKPDETSPSTAVLGKRKRDINNDGKDKPPQKQQKQQNGATATSSANGVAKKEDTTNGADTTAVNGVHKSSLDTTTENDLTHNPEFNVHIPPQIVAKGVKFLHEALDDAFIPSPSTDNKGGEQDEDGKAESDTVGSKSKNATK